MHIDIQKKPLLTSCIEEIRSEAIFFEVSSNYIGIPFQLKIEGLNIAGSIKLKPAMYMIDQLIKTKKLIVGQHKVIESSSGNLGVALSIVCKARKIPFFCIIDPNTNKNNVNLMRLYGAEVICITTRDENGGYLGTRIKTIQSMLERDKNLLWTNQYVNLNNPEAHAQSTAKEIDAAFSKIDYLFIGAGTTGTLMGCIQYFKNHIKKPKIIAVDVEGSVTFGQPPKKRNIPGLGTSKTPDILNRDLVDEIIIVDEKNTISSCHKFLHHTGLLLGGSSGSVIQAIEASKARFSHDDIIIGISPDLGERYLETIYNPEWVKQRNMTE